MWKRIVLQSSSWQGHTTENYFQGRRGKSQTDITIQNSKASLFVCNVKTRVQVQNCAMLRPGRSQVCSWLHRDGESLNNTSHEDRSHLTLDCTENLHEDRFFSCYYVDWFFRSWLTSLLVFHVRQHHQKSDSINAKVRQAAFDTYDNCT